MTSFVIGVMWMICAAACVSQWEDLNQYERKRRLVLGSFFAAFGAMGILGGLLSSWLLAVTAMLVPVAVLLLYCAVSVMRLVVQCDTMVSAVCIGYNEYSGSRGAKAYAPVFVYHFADKDYERQMPVSYSRKKVENKFAIGETYDIFIRANRPEECLAEQKLPLFHCGMGLLGVSIFVVYGVVMLQEMGFLF